MSQVRFEFGSEASIPLQRLRERWSCPLRVVALWGNYYKATVIESLGGLLRVQFAGGQVRWIAPCGTTYCLPHTAYHILPTTYCLPPTAYHILPTTYCLPLTAYHFTATTYCTAHHLLYCPPLTVLSPLAVGETRAGCGGAARDGPVLPRRSVRYHSLFQ